MADMRPEGGPDDGRCAVADCQGARRKRIWCNKHYQRWRAHGDPEKTLRPSYGSGRRERPDGYIDLWLPNHPASRSDGYVFEHRKVALEHGVLDGPDDSRHVHHVNGNKQDNRPENLMALTAEEHAKDPHQLVRKGPPIDNASKTHCVRGHDLNDPNNIYESQLPRRVCKPCARKNAKKQKGLR